MHFFELNVVFKKLNVLLIFVLFLFFEFDEVFKTGCNLSTVSCHNVAIYKGVQM